MRLRFPIRNLAFVILTVVALGACQSTGVDGLTVSNAPPEMSESAASAIAGDLVSRLSEQIGPGTSLIRLRQDGSPFGQALETALKNSGYAVVTDQKIDDKGHSIALAYVVESFERTILARLSTRTVELGRAYSVSPAGAAPTSPLSVMRRG